MHLIYLLAASSLTLAANNPPAGALVVGSGGQYKTIQQAVNAAGPGKIIFVQAGTYNEQVSFEGNKKGVVLIGQTEDSATYSKNKVTIVQSKAQDSPKGTSNDQTGTLRVHADGVKVYNINLENKRGAGSQALALSAYGNELGFYGCQFKGFQDTVMSESGKHVFAKSMIAGATDFIFGMHAQAWFEGCDIRTVNARLGYITANGRDKEDNPSFYVFNKCDVGGAAPAGAFYLGRPWRAFSRVIFQNSKLGAVVNSAGWAEWQKGEPRTSNVTWGEYRNTGPGTSGSRKFAKTLTSAVPISQILGSNHQTWVDMKYLGGDGGP